MKRKSLLMAAAVGVGYWAFSEAAERRRVSWLRDKVVLITGGSRGFGLALAEEFGRSGARLVLTARDEEELERANRDLVERGVAAEKILCIPCDLTKLEDVQRMVAFATQRMGKIDVLINNAGIMTVGPLEDQPVRGFKHAIESNYYTALYATVSVLPQMLARGNGNIVNITSIGGKVSVPHLLPYSASKFALVGFSQGLHAELRSKGICVTTVCPGLMRTGAHIQALFTGDREREYRWFSLGASLPAISIAANTAARKVVRATVSGATELIITPQASLAAAVAQMAPAFTGRVLSMVNDLVLPTPQQSAKEDLRRGDAVRNKEITSLTVLGTSAKHRWNQHGTA
ncbi:MAG TPA: SDR family NAD(P)-dependent oxidoreductase [Acidobacteriaceae bacterium]|nr:SDR family NAD(P)-dependent oxidoreductase [Acidobacteriaceae bacterium]